jgi:hypothetical protein
MLTCEPSNSVPFFFSRLYYTQHLLFACNLFVQFLPTNLTAELPLAAISLISRWFHAASSWLTPPDRPPQVSLAMAPPRTQRYVLRISPSVASTSSWINPRQPSSPQTPKSRRSPPSCVSLCFLVSVPLLHESSSLFSLRLGVVIVFVGFLRDLFTRILFWDWGRNWVRRRRTLILSPCSNSSS